VYLFYTGKTPISRTYISNHAPWLTIENQVMYLSVVFVQNGYDVINNEKEK
jgi:hypothetical protein